MPLAPKPENKLKPRLYNTIKEIGFDTILARKSQSQCRKHPGCGWPGGGVCLEPGYRIWVSNCSLDCGVYKHDSLNLLMPFLLGEGSTCFWCAPPPKTSGNPSLCHTTTRLMYRGQAQSQTRLRDSAAKWLVNYYTAAAASLSTLTESLIN